MWGKAKKASFVYGKAKQSKANLACLYLGCFFSVGFLHTTPIAWYRKTLPGEVLAPIFDDVGGLYPLQSGFYLFSCLSSESVAGLE